MPEVEISATCGGEHLYWVKFVQMEAVASRQRHKIRKQKTLQVATSESCAAIAWQNNVQDSTHGYKYVLNMSSDFFWHAAWDKGLR